MPDFMKNKSPSVDYKTVSMEFVEIPDLGFNLDKENQLKVWCPMNDVKYVAIWESHPKVTIMVKKECFQVTNVGLKIRPEYVTQFKEPIDREETLSEEKILKFQDIEAGASGVDISPSIYMAGQYQEPVKTSEADSEVVPRLEPINDQEVDSIVEPSELQNTKNQSSCENNKDRSIRSENENQYQHAKNDAASHNTDIQSVSQENTQNELIESEKGNQTQGKETDVSNPANHSPPESENDNRSENAHSQGLFSGIDSDPDEQNNPDDLDENNRNGPAEQNNGNGSEQNNQNNEEEFVLVEIENDDKYKIKFFKKEIHIRFNNVIKIFPIVEHSVEDNDAIFVYPNNKNDRVRVWDSFLEPFRVDKLFKKTEEELKGYYFIRIKDCLKERQYQILDSFWTCGTATPLPNLGYLLMDDELKTTSGLTGN